MQSFFSASAKKKTLGGRRERKKCKLNGKSSEQRSALGWTRSSIACLWSGRKEKLESEDLINRGAIG
jgi:hypothetical protein